jgi:hypothetical protein
MAPVGTDTESTYKTTKMSPLNEVMGHWSVGIIDSADSAYGADLAHGAKAKGTPSSNGVAALPKCSVLAVGPAQDTPTIDAQLKPCEAAAAGDTGDAPVHFSSVSALVSTCSTAKQSAL